MRMLLSLKEISVGSSKVVWPLSKCSNHRSVGVPRRNAACSEPRCDKTPGGDGLPGSSAAMEQTDDAKVWDWCYLISDEWTQSDLCFFFVLRFTRRTCNRLAHECARLVSRENPVDEFLVIPLGLRDIAQDDCNIAHE
jgi:hypothetical protein